MHTDLGSSQLIVAMLCYICEKNICLCLGVRIMDHVYSRGTSMKKG